MWIWYLIIIVTYLGGIFLYVEEEIADFLSGDIIDKLYLYGGEHLEEDEDFDEYIIYVNEYYSYISAICIIFWPFFRLYTSVKHLILFMYVHFKKD